MAGSWLVRTCAIPPTQMVHVVDAQLLDDSCFPRQSLTWPRNPLPCCQTACLPSSPALSSRKCNPLRLSTSRLLPATNVGCWIPTQVSPRLFHGRVGFGFDVCAKRGTRPTCSRSFNSCHFHCHQDREFGCGRVVSCLRDAWSVCYLAS